MEHRKKIKHYHQPGHLHEFTFSCYLRRPLLTNSTWLAMLSRSIDSANQAELMDLVAFVFMPEHVHLLVSTLSKTPNWGRYLARIKQPFSKQIKQLLIEQNSGLLAELTVLERPGKHCFRFWQEGAGFDRNLFSETALQNAIAYIHNNPIRRALCQRPTEWPWSSARFYFQQEQSADLPYITKSELF